MGTCDAGLTDSDDAFVAIDDGMPVQMLPVRVTSLSSESLPTDSRNPSLNAKPDKVLGKSAGFTICIPNTVGIINGTKRRQAAQQLIDFLTSKETELALAKATSRQIPLGPIDPAQLPNDLRNLTEWSRDGIDLRSLLPARRECLKWLQSEYLK